MGWTHLREGKSGAAPEALLARRACYPQGGIVPRGVHARILGEAWQVREPARAAAGAVAKDFAELTATRV